MFKVVEFKNDVLNINLMVQYYRTEPKYNFKDFIEALGGHIENSEELFITIDELREDYYEMFSRLDDYSIAFLRWLYEEVIPQVLDAMKLTVAYSYFKSMDKSLQTYYLPGEWLKSHDIVETNYYISKYSELCERFGRATGLIPLNNQFHERILESCFHALEFEQCYLDNVYELFFGE